LLVVADETARAEHVFVTVATPEDGLKDRVREGVELPAVPAAAAGRTPRKCAADGAPGLWSGAANALV